MVLVGVFILVLVIAMSTTAFATSNNSFRNFRLKSHYTFSQIERYDHTQFSPYYTNFSAAHDSGGTSNGKHNARFWLDSGSTGYKSIINAAYYIWSKRACQTARLRIENDYARGIYLTISGGYSLIP
jgi:hypothetical protein